MDLGLIDGWQPILRTMVAGVIGYAGVIALLRGAGKRSIAKINMFDFVLTVALGSILATLILSKDVTVVQALAGFGTLLFLQMAVTFSTSRFAWARDLFVSEPRLLFHDGQFLEDAMRKERVSKEELRSEARDASLGSLDLVMAMVLETDGTVSVIPKSQAGDLANVPGTG